MKALLVAFLMFVVVLTAHADILGQEEMMAAMEQFVPAAKTAGGIDFNTASTQEVMDYFSSWGEWAVKFDYWRAHEPAQGTLRLFYGSVDTKLDSRAERGSFQARHIATVPGVYLFAQEGCDVCTWMAEILTPKASELAEQVYELRGNIEFDIDGDPNVYVVIYEFDGEDDRWGGYVHYNDMMPFKYGSNGAETIHINANCYYSLRTLSNAFAHELTHIVDISRDPRELSWMREGFAELTSYELGLRSAERFFSSPLDESECLREWEGKSEQYESAFQFVKWFYNHYGQDAGQYLFRETYNGQESVLRVLNSIRWDVQYTWDEVWYEYSFCRRADFNGDGKVDDSDWIAMSDRMRDNSTDPKYDLDGDGVVSYSDLMMLENRQISASMAFEPQVVIKNYPNPFNAQTTIGFSIPENELVNLTVYNMVGQVVRTLVAGDNLSAGEHKIVWDGTDDFGTEVGAGMYISCLNVGQETLTRKMTLVK